MAPRSALLVCLAALGFGSGRAAAAPPSPQAIEAKVALEGSVEKRLDAVLQRLLGSENVIAIVNVQLVHETQAESSDDLLPGVPTKDSPGAPAPLEISSNLVRRISATVYLDKSASEADVQVVRDTVQRMLGLSSQRGDTLAVEKISFQNQSAPARKIPEGWVMAAIWMVLAMALILVLNRFMGPIPGLIREAVESLKARANVREAQAESAKPDEAAGPAVGPVAAGAIGGAASGRTLPFSFIEERDLPTLKLILRGQQPMTAAVILHYLPPPMAADILGTLSSGMREQILSLMRRPAVLDVEEVAQIEESLRAQIDYLMGGDDQLLALLDGANPSFQTAVLSDLRRLDPALAQRLSQRIVTLDDLMILDDAAFKLLGRQIPMQSLATAISTSEAIKKSVMGHLRGGLAEWLAQEVELQGALAPAVVEERVRQVVAALTKLVREGRIALRKASAPPELAPTPRPKPATEKKEASEP